jgi:hypothetical protein
MRACARCYWIAPPPAQLGRPGPGTAFGNRTFTRPSLGVHEVTSRWADTGCDMESPGRLLFVVLVTCYLLGRIFGCAVAPLEVLVYGITAAFGLEYLVASWDGLWQRG